MDGRELLLLTFAAIILICSANPLTLPGKLRGVGSRPALVQAHGSAQIHRLPPGSLQLN
jgi:hypothetical protein